uniref:Uncharacterized protein n=1 Tax=Trypanosoma vivax (strain Y486) TaxID=1055687 RepID=G0U5M5_TRYVY|nr:hypothetical protein, unlikely [Trypanosoma vivax Y486]
MKLTRRKRRRNTTPSCRHGHKSAHTRTNTKKKESKTRAGKVVEVGRCLILKKKQQQHKKDGNCEHHRSEPKQPKGMEKMRVHAHVCACVCKSEKCGGGR